MKAQYLRDLIENAGLTLTSAARILEVDRRTLSRWCSHKEFGDAPKSVELALKSLISPWKGIIGDPPKVGMLFITRNSKDDTLQSYRSAVHINYPKTLHDHLLSIMPSQDQWMELPESRPKSNRIK